jgi:DNA-binding transcriptional regulator YdaS (Cro superfamily)
MTPIQQAIEKAGGSKALADVFSIKRQAVEKWASENRVPADRVLRIEECTGVSRHDLRPDIYPRESDAA